MKRWIVFVTAVAGCHGQASLPQIAAVVSASAYGQFKSIAPGTWIEIYGSNLASTSRPWASTDFIGINAPTMLDQTSVMIGGQVAFVEYINSGQVNVQVPSNVGSGPQNVTVATPAGTSLPYSINVNAAQPGLLAPPSFNVGGTQYVTALFPDGVTYVLPPNAIPGVASKRAAPGDTITMYGIGFGPVTPSIPAGQVVQSLNALALPFHLFFGNAEATLPYAGLAPQAVGLYQFNVVVPDVSPADSVPVTFTLGGTPGAQTLALPVQAAAAQSKLQNLTLDHASATGGTTVEATVVLSAPAPAGGSVISLTADSAAVTVPGSVTIPEGVTTSSVSIQTTAVGANQNVTISAAYNGATVQVVLTLVPPAPVDLTGKWAGSFVDTLASGNETWQLTQKGTMVTGTVALAGVASYSGVITGSTDGYGFQFMIQASFSQFGGTCNETASGETTSLTATTLMATFSGTSCNGSFAGTIDLSR